MQKEIQGQFKIEREKQLEYRRALLLSRDKKDQLSRLKKLKAERLAAQRDEVYASDCLTSQQPVSLQLRSLGNRELQLPSNPYPSASQPRPPAAPPQAVSFFTGEAVIVDHIE